MIYGQCLDHQWEATIEIDAEVLFPLASMLMFCIDRVIIADITQGF